jgi:DNA mismatch repair protein MutH
MTGPLPPPRDEAELLARLAALRGRTLGAVAEALSVPVPREPRRAKGWAGALLERALGAVAGSSAGPDLPALGVELKTIPVAAGGRPLESTFVASLELGALDRRWETSAVNKKLRRVCFIPVQADRDLPIALRRCGPALLWSPSAEQDAALRRDYEEIVELIGEGFSSRVTGHRGLHLQLRPKGRNAADLRWALDEEGAPVRTAPRAFYLRRTFTEAILRLLPPTTP